LLLLPTSNTYRREEVIGVIDAMQDAVSEREVIVLLLSPDASANDAMQEFDREQGSKKEGRNKINYKVIREATTPNTVTILVVDRTRSLIIEQQDDSKLDFEKAIGLATYSTRGSTVKSNIRFFERMWEEVGEREREEMLLQKEIRSRREAELLQDILAHDIRNFNQITLMSAELLKTEKFSAIEARPLIDDIMTATERSRNLIDKAKSLGKIISQENVKLFPVNLEDSLRRSMEIAIKAHREKVVIPTFALKRDAKVRADDFLDDAFTNVLSNAINYTEGETVPIEISVEEMSEDQKYYKVAITDHGKGIPDGAKEKVFTRYLETARGSGLGLSIVYALVVDRYSGKVRVRNAVEGDFRQGTVIELWLPAAS
ncbi:MAG: sensor histidine kinase, partial [Nitrososphaerales archaeon]